MRHRLQRKVFDGKKSPQKSRSSSTFTIGKNPRLAKHKLHSKSTYFYRWGSRKCDSGDASGSSLASFQRHPVGLCLLRANCKSQDTYLRNAHPAQPEDDALRKDCRRKNLGKASRLTYLVPSVCALALLIGGIICINPTLDNSKVYAEELDFNTTNTNSTNADFGIMPTANSPAINLTIAPNTNDSTNSNVTAGEVAYFSSTVTVGGSNIAQYSLSLSTPSGSSGNLVGQTNPSVMVGKVNAGTAPSNFSDNTWGYAVSNTVNTNKTAMSYSPVPSGNNGGAASHLAFRTGLSGTVNDSYKLVFAAKLGSNMPVDHYRADVYISAVGNAETVAGLGFTGAGKTIYTMQDMTTEICRGATDTDTQHQLIDVRDSKVYWVAKLKDGNCWMTQNLDFDVTEVLDPSTTDVPTIKNSGATKILSVSNWTPPSNNAYTYGAYYDPGNYYYTNKSRGSVECRSTVGFAQCLDAGFATSYADKHYHIGNYYTFYTATAMSGDVTSSICPKNWQLPKSDNNAGVSGSFARLLNAYGLSQQVSVSGYSIYDAPLYFVYGGAITSGQIYNAALSGFYRSLAFSAGTLTFDTSVRITDSTPMYGTSVRCVAK